MCCHQEWLRVYHFHIYAENRGRVCSENKIVKKKTVNYAKVPARSLTFAFLTQWFLHSTKCIKYVLISSRKVREVCVQSVEGGNWSFNDMTQDTTRVYFRFTILFLIAGAVFGILAAFFILLPDAFRSQPVPGFGRMVAAHRSLMIHGVIFSAVLGTCYALLTKLACVDGGPRRSGTILAWAGNLIVASGTVLILAGFGSGREYSDLPGQLSILYWLFLTATAIDIASIISKQKILTPNPALGFLFLAAILTPVVYPFTISGWWGNGLFESTRIWVAWRTIFTGVFLFGAVGVSLWMLGMNGRKISIPAGAFTLGIGLLAVFSPFIGIVHQLDAPLWSGLKAFGAFSASFAGTGLLLVAFSLWKIEKITPPALLLCGGLAGLAATAVQGIILLVPPVYSTFHFTANTSGHAHLALGSIVSIMLGGILMIAPRISGHRMVGTEKLLGGVGAILTGILIVFIFLSSAGVIQAMAFSKGLSPSDWLPTFSWLHAGIIAGGVIFLTGAGVTGSVIIRTINYSRVSRLVPVEDDESKEIITDEETIEGGDV